VNAFNRIPIYGRVLLVGFAALALLELVGGLVAPLGGGAQDTSGSSYSSHETGLGAYADLLAAAGHDVARIRSELDETEARLPTQATLVVAGVPLTDSEQAVVARFVEDGGRLVAVGPPLVDTLRRVVDDSISWRDGIVLDARPLVPVPETVGVVTVSSGASGMWGNTGAALPVLGQGGQQGQALAAVANVGRGRVVLIADAALLYNALLAETDNAAFGLAVAGSPDRPVFFAEAAHVADQGTGVAAIPSRWKWALAAGGIAAILAMWSASRRFGPPEDEARDLPPPRRTYVDAVAATLIKTRQPDLSLAPLRQAARERVYQRASLPPHATDAQVRRAAEDLGLAPDEIDALFGAVTSDDNAMAVGRAMARLGGQRW
jgi:hypothetical protein